MILTPGMGMMFGRGRRPIELVGIATEASSSSRSSTTLTPPVAVLPNDFVVIAGMHDNSSYTATATGFSGGGLGSFAHLLYKKAGVSEPASYTVTFSSSAIGGSNILLVLRNAWSEADFSNGAVTTTLSSTHTASSFTATQRGALFMFSAINSTTKDRTIVTPPANMTEVAIWSDGNSAPSSACYVQYDQPAGATGTRSLTWDNGSSNSPAFLFQVPQG